MFNLALADTRLTVEVSLDWDDYMAPELPPMVEAIDAEETLEWDDILPTPDDETTVYSQEHLPECSHGTLGAEGGSSSATTSLMSLTSSSYATCDDQSFDARSNHNGAKAKQTTVTIDVDVAKILSKLGWNNEGAETNKFRNDRTVSPNNVKIQNRATLDKNDLCQAWVENNKFLEDQNIRPGIFIVPSIPSRNKCPVSTSEKHESRRLPTSSNPGNNMEDRTLTNARNIPEPKAGGTDTSGSRSFQSLSDDSDLIVAYLSCSRSSLQEWDYHSIEDLSVKPPPGPSSSDLLAAKTNSHKFRYPYHLTPGEEATCVTKSTSLQLDAEAMESLYERVARQLVRDAIAMAIQKLFCNQTRLSGDPTIGIDPTRVARPSEAQNEAPLNVSHLQNTNDRCPDSKESKSRSEQMYDSILDSNRNIPESLKEQNQISEITANGSQQNMELLSVLASRVVQKLPPSACIAMEVDIAKEIQIYTEPSISDVPGGLLKGQDQMVMDEPDTERRHLQGTPKDHDHARVPRLQPEIPVIMGQIKRCLEDNIKDTSSFAGRESQFVKGDQMVMDEMDIEQRQLPENNKVHDHARLQPKIPVTMRQTKGCLEDNIEDKSSLIGRDSQFVKGQDQMVMGEPDIERRHLVRNAKDHDHAHHVPHLQPEIPVTVAQIKRCPRDNTDNKYSLPGRKLGCSQNPVLIANQIFSRQPPSKHLRSTVSTNTIKVPVASGKGSTLFYVSSESKVNNTVSQHSRNKDLGNNDYLNPTNAHITCQESGKGSSSTLRDKIPPREESLKQCFPRPRDPGQYPLDKVNQTLQGRHSAQQAIRRHKHGTQVFFQAPGSQTGFFPGPESITQEPKDTKPSHNLDETQKKSSRGTGTSPPQPSSGAHPPPVPQRPTRRVFTFPEKAPPLVMQSFGFNHVARIAGMFESVLEHK